jgi:hypothetical protein
LEIYIDVNIITILTDKHTAHNGFIFIFIKMKIKYINIIKFLNILILLNS